MYFSHGKLITLYGRCASTGPRPSQKGDLHLKSAGPEYAQATVAGAFELVGTNVRLLSIVRTEKAAHATRPAAAVAGAMRRSAPPRSEPGKA